MKPWMSLFEPLLLDDEGRLLARVADVSLYSALIFARQGRFAIGERIAGRLDSPPHDGRDEISVRVRLTVRWIAPENLGGWSCLGCAMELIDVLSGAQLKRLAELALP